MKGKKIELMELGVRYLEDYLLLVNDPLVHETTEPHEEFKPYSKKAVLDWLTGLDLKEDREDFAILELGSGQFAGEIVLNEIQDDQSTCNLRIALLPKYFDKGYGTEAIQLAVKHGFDVMGLSEIALEVYDSNPRGVRVYEKSGFEHVGETSEGEFRLLQMRKTRIQPQ